MASNIQSISIDQLIVEFKTFHNDDKPLNPNKSVYFTLLTRDCSGISKSTEDKQVELLTAILGDENSKRSSVEQSELFELLFSQLLGLGYFSSNSLKNVSNLFNNRITGISNDNNDNLRIRRRVSEVSEIFEKRVKEQTLTMPCQQTYIKPSNTDLVYSSSPSNKLSNTNSDNNSTSSFYRPWMIVALFLLVITLLCAYFFIYKNHA